MTVSTTCSPRNFELMKSLGATEVIDYHTERIQDRIRGFDIFFDTLGYETEELVLSPHSEVKLFLPYLCSTYMCLILHRI